mgnify:CR=1 FL=1
MRFRNYPVKIRGCILTLFEIFIFFVWKTRENVAVLDFLAVDNWFHEKNCQKKNLGWKTREIEFLDKKKLTFRKLRHRKKKNFGITLFFRTIGEILRKITSTVTITGSLLFSTVTDPNTRNQWKENFCRKLKLMYRIQITTKTIGNQVSTEQMYLGYVWFKRWWPYCIIMMYSDVFLHYIDDWNYNWHQCIMDWVMRNILGVFFYKIQ